MDTSAQRTSRYLDTEANSKMKELEQHGPFFAGTPEATGVPMNERSKFVSIFSIFIS